jgi:hypothetical protein
MNAALWRLTQIENEERNVRGNPELLMERKVKLIDEYGHLMTELTMAVLGDSGMPHVDPPNMVELAEQFYRRYKTALV